MGGIECGCLDAGRMLLSIYAVWVDTVRFAAAVRRQSDFLSCLVDFGNWIFAQSGGLMSQSR